MMRAVPSEPAERGELIALAEADLARLRDRLAEIEAEHAMLEAELAVFEADYTCQVVTVLAQLHDVEAKILARGGDAAIGRPAAVLRGWLGPAPLLRPVGLRAILRRA